jgi:hypothetical protein
MTATERGSPICTPPPAAYAHEVTRRDLLELPFCEQRKRAVQHSDDEHVCSNDSNLFGWNFERAELLCE